jgi:predicted DNA-binding ribbon-helix-helix protein
MTEHKHSQKEMEEIAAAHNMTVDELQAHMAEHENMAFVETHKVLLNKEFTDEELEIMAREHDMTLEQMKSHIEMAKQHHHQ